MKPALDAWVRLSAASLAAAFLLTACATQSARVPGIHAEQAYQQRLDYLVSLDAWSLNGRLAASDSKEGGSGALIWQKSSDTSNMSFRGAMGKGAWELEAGKGWANLRFADGREYSAAGISELVTNHLRIDVPVEALSWWVLGLAWSNTWQDRQLDEEGRMTGLSQLGWNVKFSGYKLQDQVWLPGKLVARKREKTVKLAVSDWSLQPETLRSD